MSRSADRMSRSHSPMSAAVAAGALAVSFATAAQAADDAPAAATPPPKRAGAAPVKKPAVPREVIALLGGLHPGDVLAGWKVRSIEGPKDKVMSVTVAKGPLWFCATFAHLGASPYNPPVSTGQYALYFDNLHPAKTSMSREELKKVLDALAVRIKKHEATVPVPPGM